MDNKVQHIQVPHDLGVAKEIKMNPTDYLIYGYMRKNMDKDTFQTFVSLRTLAELARVSINTVQSSIKKLNAAGEIKILEKKKGRSNIYEIQKSGRYFERFTYEFMDAENTTPEEKGVLLAMQQYTSTNDGQFAITTKTNKELAAKMDISTKVLTRVFRQLDTFIIGKLYSAASLGLFNRAKSLNNLVIECSFSAIRSTMLPTFSKLQNDVELLRNSIIKLIHVISFLTFLFAGLMYMCADDLIIILYGNKWEGAIEIFKILGLFSITICLPVVYDAIISVVNRMSLYLWIGIIRNMILLIAIPFGIIYGFHAYIWSVSIASGINLIPYFFAANTCIQLPVASQIYTIVRYVAPFIFAILLWQIIDYSSRNHFIDIFLKSIYFLCTYVGYNMWAKNNGYVICQTLIKNTVAKNKK